MNLGLTAATSQLVYNIMNTPTKTAGEAVYLKHGLDSRYANILNRDYWESLAKAAIDFHLTSVSADAPGADDLLKIYYDRVGREAPLMVTSGLFDIRNALLAWHAGKVKALEEELERIGREGRGDIVVLESQQKEIQMLEKKIESLHNEYTGRELRLTERYSHSEKCRRENAEEARLWEKRYDEQTLTAADALKQRDEAREKIAKLNMRLEQAAADIATLVEQRNAAVERGDDFKRVLEMAKDNLREKRIKSDPPTTVTFDRENVTDEQLEAALVITSRWLHEHPELTELVIKHKVASAAVEAAKS